MFTIYKRTPIHFHPISYYPALATRHYAPITSTPVLTRGWFPCGRPPADRSVISSYFAKVKAGDPAGQLKKAGVGVGIYYDGCNAFDHILDHFPCISPLHTPSHTRLTCPS